MWPDVLVLVVSIVSADIAAVTGFAPEGYRRRYQES
jgi:hypothetical protein